MCRDPVDCSDEHVNPGRFQLNHGISANHGAYDEDTRLSLLSELEAVAKPPPVALPSEQPLCDKAVEKGEEVAEGGAAEESGEGRVVDIVDTDGDRLRFALSRDGTRVSLAVNGRPAVASVRMVAADERTGLVNDGGGLFRIREGERADKLGALGALLAVVGGGVQPAQEQDRPGGSYGDAGEGAGAPAMLRRAWAELGVPLDGSGLPHGEKLHVVERLRLSPTGRTLTDRITIEDPQFYTRPWYMKVDYALRPDLSIQEYACGEPHRALVKAVKK